ncbi:hypothetical protein Tco_1275856 [Tanacetum coccineum]
MINSRFHYGDGTTKNLATVLAGSFGLHWPVLLWKNDRIIKYGLGYLTLSSESQKGTDNQEKDEKQSQNDKTGLGMEKTVKDKAKSKPESQSSQKVNRKVNWSKSKSTQVNPGAKVKEI